MKNRSSRENYVARVSWSLVVVLLPVFISCAAFEKVKSYWLSENDAKKEEVTIKTGVDSQFSLKEIEAFDELLSNVSSKYVFDSTDLRDPFNPQATTAEGIGKETDTKEVADAEAFPLTKFPMSDFVLSAIIWGISAPRAVLKTSSGKSHIVTIGSFIGNKFGRIKDIQKHKIVVEESSKDPTGNTVIKDIELTISGYDPKKADLNISLVSSSAVKSGTSQDLPDEGSVPESSKSGSEVQNTATSTAQKTEEIKKAQQENDD